MMSFDLANLITNLGFPIALVIYLLMRDKARDKSDGEREQERETDAKERERRLGTRIDNLEDEHRRELVTLVENTTIAVRESSAVNRELLVSTRNMHSSVTALVTVMQTSPCQAGYKRTDSDRLVIDPDVADAIERARLRRQPTELTPVPQAATHENYEPHPSNSNIPGPGEPPQTPMPISRRQAREDEARRRG